MSPVKVSAALHKLICCRHNESPFFNNCSCGDFDCVISWLKDYITSCWDIWLWTLTSKRHLSPPVLVSFSTVLWTKQRQWSSNWHYQKCHSQMLKNSNVKPKKSDDKAALLKQYTATYLPFDILTKAKMFIDFTPILNIVGIRGMWSAQQDLLCRTSI